MFRELRALRAGVDLAACVAGNARLGWRNSRMGLNRVLPVGTSTAWGSRDSPDLNCSNRPVRTRMPGGVGGVGSAMTGPYPDSARRFNSVRTVSNTGPRSVPLTAAYECPPARIAHDYDAARCAPGQPRPLH
jgi:hypothetical protein